MNDLFYGDNLDVLRDRRKISEESIDLCYIDPPFNSKRNYNQIYNNVGEEDRAQAQAFMDTWVWDDRANAGYTEILSNSEGRFQFQLVELIKGLGAVLQEGSLLAYLISISLRVTEVHRVLKPTGSFYLHCDPTASHYLKIVLDAICCSQGGTFLNEIDWCYKSGGASKRNFSRKHDVILFYVKSKTYTFNYQQEKYYNRGLRPYRFKGVEEFKDEVGWYTMVGMKDYWNIDMVGRTSAERLGFPTQKPLALLERIISASSNEGDMVLDAYCGCGTSVTAAQALKRKWVGIDITFQSISLILRRLEDVFGKNVLENIHTSDIPRDMASAQALAHRKDDRLRKEFEKWAVLTYTNNRAIINEKKGADGGVDARAFFMTGKFDNARIIFQVKSGGVKRGDIATLRGDMGREKAALAVLITLEEPSRVMVNEAKAAGQYHHETMGKEYDQIAIITVEEIVRGKRLEIPMSFGGYQESTSSRGRRRADGARIVIWRAAMQINPTYITQARPSPADASPYHFTYINLVETEDILSTLTTQLPEALTYLNTYTDQSSLHRYAPDKWSIRQVLNHIADTERIFTHRALWFARGLPGALASFDQRIAATHAEVDTISYVALLDDFTNVRRATLSLFGTLPPAAWSRAGMASDHRFTVNALAFMTAGHLTHHLAILRERYIPS